MNWSELVEIIATHERFVLTSHIRPDADALGSELGLARILKRMGKQVRIANASPTPARLAFLDPAGEISVLGQTITDAEILATDVHLIVDTSAWSQLGDLGRAFRKSNAVKVIIDHHVSSDDMGAIVFKDVLAEATGTLIFELLQALEQPLSVEIAEPLFCAIATDTGWFRFPSTRQHTMHVIGALIQAGVRPCLIYEQLYEQSTIGRMKLAGRALERMTVEPGGLLAHTYVKFDDYGETGAEPPDTEDLVNECLRIRGVRCALIAIEQPNRQVKISFRSREGINVAVVAEGFQGGGHKQAAGAILPGPLTEAYQRGVTAMRQALPPTA